MAEQTTQPDENRLRMTLDFSPEAHARLEEMRAECEHQTRGPVIRKGLQLLDWLVEQEQQGWRVVAVNENGEVKELRSKDL